VAERKNLLLRLDPAVCDALARWAGDELRSTTAQIELLLRRALADAGRTPSDAGGLPRRGRPPKRAPASVGESADGWSNRAGEGRAGGDRHGDGDGRGGGDRSADGGGDALARPRQN